MPLIEKVKPLMQAALWIVGGFSLIYMVAKRRSWKDILLTLFGISLVSAFIYDPKNIYEFGGTAVKGITSAGEYFIDIIKL